MRLRQVVGWPNSLIAIAVAGALATSFVATAAPAHAGADPHPRIVGGVTANRAQTPWFVLLNPIIDGQSYVCGGTAIDSHWILTAAHCVTDVDGWPMRMGDVVDSSAFVNPVSINSAADLGPRLGWQQVIVNPYFDRQLLVSDVALVQTTAALPAFLPYSSDGSGPSSGTALQVFGFGATSYGGPLSPTLRMGNVMDVAGVAGPCGQYGSFYHSVSEECAGFPPGPTDSCQGDSGGPLTAAAQTAQRVAVGVVSFGVDCGRPGYPGVYTRVASFANWISSETGVAPNPSPVGSHSGPALSVAKPCRGTAKKPCRLKRGGKLTLRLGNAGGTAASWSVRAKIVTIRPGTGSLASGATVGAALIAKTARKTCVLVTVRSQAGVAASFKLSLNGGRCR